MNEYNFTIHIDRIPTDAEADALYEAGLDDANIQEGNGRASLIITREAKTLDDAILSAVANIRSAGFTPTGIANEDLVTLPAIARKTGRSHESIRLLAAGRRGAGNFPAPISGNLYSWSQVRQWFATHNETMSNDTEGDTLAAADMFLRACLLRPAGRLAELVNN